MNADTNTSKLSSNQLDHYLAAGPEWSIPSVVAPPVRGERCHRCHRTSPPMAGCTVCAPDRVPPARATTPTLIDVSARSSFISSFAYQGTTDGFGFLAIFFKAGHATLYRGVPPTIPGLLASGHTNAKSDGELSVGATYNRLIKGVYEGQTVSEAGKVAELRRLMGGE